MFKSVLRGTKRAGKSLFNVPKWMGWHRLKQNNQTLLVMFKDVLFPSTSNKQIDKSFEEAVSRLGLDQETLDHRQRVLKFLSYVYMFFALLIFGYAFYLLFWVGTYLGFFTTLSLVCATLALAFKNHFWYTQIRNKRLGLTFWQWFFLAFGIKK